MLVIDEAQTYTSPHKIPKGFKNALMLSRHYQINIIFSTQRPSQISRDLTSQASRFIIFNLQEKSDVEFFIGFIGKEAYNIPLLKPFHYLDVDLLNHSITEKMLFRK